MVYAEGPHKTRHAEANYKLGSLSYYGVVVFLTHPLVLVLVFVVLGGRSFPTTRMASTAMATSSVRLVIFSTLVCTSATRVTGLSRVPGGYAKATIGTR